MTEYRIISRDRASIRDYNDRTQTHTCWNGDWSKTKNDHRLSPGMELSIDDRTRLLTAFEPTINQTKTRTADFTQNYYRNNSFHVIV